MAGSGRNIFTWKILSFLTLLCHFNDVYARYASAKIVVMPLPVVSSQYFNMLEIAEEMQRRGNEVLTFISNTILRYFSNNAEIIKPASIILASNMRGESQYYRHLIPDYSTIGQTMEIIPKW